MLGEIAFESENPGPASRAVFMLAQSSLPKARETVVRVARQGPEPVRVAAVRDLGRFGGPEASQDLVELYATAIGPVKLQIVKSLAERSEKAPLLRIAESEKDGTLRFTAINGLGQAGGAPQLAMLYKSATVTDQAAHHRRPLRGARRSGIDPHRRYRERRRAEEGSAGAPAAPRDSQSEGLSSEGQRKTVDIRKRFTKPGTGALAGEA